MVIWLRNALEELIIVQNPTVKAQDNSRAIDLAEVENEMHLGKHKHIDVKVNYAIDLVERKVIKLEKVESSEIVADYLTRRLVPTGYVNEITSAKIFSRHSIEIPVYRKLIMPDLDCRI